MHNIFLIHAKIHAKRANKHFQFQNSHEKRAKAHFGHYFWKHSQKNGNNPKKWTLLLETQYTSNNFYYKINCNLHK